MTSESELIFHLLYLLFTYCIVYPPKEFIAIGLTTDQICAKVFGFMSEDHQFIQYHQKRTILTAVIHSFVPFLYTTLYTYHFSDNGLNDFINGYKNAIAHGQHQYGNVVIHVVWQAIVILSIVIPPLVAMCAFYWYWQNWQRHPLTVDLQKYVNIGQNWRDVATSINDEFRRQDKLLCRVNAITTVIATENWVIKTSPYFVHIAHQSDTALIAVKSDTHLISQDSSETVQFVNIIVKPTRTGMAEFGIRVNALNFKELQDRIHRPIIVLSGVNFNRSVMERFVEAFKDLIARNPKYHTDQELDSCFACMQATPNIKLQKQCSDIDVDGQQVPESGRCGSCYCRPMWCVDCMAKWFASRQNEYEKEVWLQQKCTCPMCRSSFCILDVSYVERTQP